jgi:hypothetical protein
MIRFLLRLAATVALAVAVVLAVIDATRSIAASALTFTTLAQSWQTVSPQSLEAAHKAVEQSAWPEGWTMIVMPLLALPAFAVVAVLALILYAAGHRRRRNRRPGYAGV